MGQQLSNANLQIINLIESDHIILNSITTLPDDKQRDVNFFSSEKILPNMTNCEYRVLRSKKAWIKEAQNNLSLLTNASELEMKSIQIDKVFMTTIFMSIISDYERIIQQIKDMFKKCEQIKLSLKNKMEEDKNLTKIQNKDQHSSFASKFSTLFKSAERNFLTAVHHLFESEKNDTAESTLSNDQITERQVEKILLNFSMPIGLLKHVLPILSQLIFDTVHVYDVRHVVSELNNHFEQVREEWEKQYINEFKCHSAQDNSDQIKQPTDRISSSILTYLISIGVYPNQCWKKFHMKRISGQLISVIILAHIDFHNTIYSNKQFDSVSVNSSMSFEFHPNIFKQLFHIIEQLTIIKIEHLTENLVHILTICLKLFTTHLKFLSAITTNLHRDLLATNENIKEIIGIPSSASNKEVELNEFITDNEVQIWFDTLLILACRDNGKLGETTISQEASKAIIYVLNIKMTSFIEKLSFIHNYIVENKYISLIEQLIIELNTNTTLLSWIEVLCDNNDNKSEKTKAFTILYTLIDVYLNPSNSIKIQIIEQILQKFQKLIFIRLRSNMGSSTFLLAIKYLTYILSNPNGKQAIINDILIGLCLMTDAEKQFNFVIIQPMFTAVLPLLTEFILQNTISEMLTINNLHYSYWLLGKISRFLINGPPQNLIELNYVEKLKSPLFIGGCESKINEKNQYLLDLFQSNIAIYSQFKQIDYNEQQSLFDHEFLMSIYNNIDKGAQLILKMKMHTKDKQNLLQKSIEQQANDACAALFAVYIKYYRRINLAKFELSRANDQKPHYKLLSIYKYANRIQTLFATTKGQGGDCNELSKQIKIKTLFLLLSIKESHLISIIETINNEQMNQEQEFKLKRQYSRRKIEKSNFRLVRNLFQACIRFKKIMLDKKRAIEQNQDNEQILNHTIENYINNDEYNNSQISNEIIECMSKQYERAMTRLITYHFIQQFIQKMLNIKDKNLVLTLLTIYLPYIRNSNIKWSYLENITATNIQLKQDIGNIYYSIIINILSYLLQSSTNDQMILIQNIFNSLNLSYKLEDIYYLNDYKYLDILFIPFISFIEESDWIILIKVKLIGYNWFRLYVLKFCEIYESEELKNRTNFIFNQKQDFIFHKLILNELKNLKQRLSIDIEDKVIKNDLSSKTNVELCIIKWLMLVFRCVHSYEHVRSVCATNDYMELLLYIYRNCQNNSIILLALKILRKIILFLPENINEQSKTMMKSLLNEILFSIGDHFSSHQLTEDILTELIYIYRVLMIFKSSWQIMATQIIFDTITLNFKSFNIVDTIQINNLLASLCILGGYIQPFCLSSVVQIFFDDEINNETPLGVVIDINNNARDSNISENRPYFIHYAETDKTEWVSADKLRIEIDIPPPDILALPNGDELVHLLFDILSYFIQLNTIDTESLLLLQLKRRSIAVLYRILTNKNLVEIFLEKPYASIIAKLSTTTLLSKYPQQPKDLHLSNKRHLEQYCLSLDRAEYSKQIIEDTIVTDKDKSLFIVWNDHSFKKDRLTIDLQSTNTSESYEWKSKASKTEIQLFKQGRNGNDEIVIVPMPTQLSCKWWIEECGTMHRFLGRTYLVLESSTPSLATFIIDNLQLSEGKWYYCVRLLGGSFAQIGWATNGFKPSTTIGIGNDKYSWSFDGSQGMLYNNDQYPFLNGNIRWKQNDVCGCGIEIESDNIRINYWLNGHFLGTPFAHQFPIDSTTTICDMLPNAAGGIYFPGISLKVNDVTTFSSCEFIFSPEDMFECPLPKDYKPLLMPTLVPINNLLVPYPYSAYLIDDEDDSYKIRNNNSITVLRDFVNNKHLETTFIYDKHQLILTQESNGFPLTIDHYESLTISFDFQILTSLKNLDIFLLTFDTTEIFSIRIPSKKINDEVRIAIVFHQNDQKVKIYINNEYRIFECPIINKFNIHILPTIACGIRNLAIWKYALLEENIRHLFNFGLTYVAMDYHRVNDYRKEMNTFTFTSNQQYFTNELLVPFNESFDENKWEKKKQEADMDEWKYFKSIDDTNQSTIQLFGNKTYLVLNKSINSWFEYTLILDISIVQLPTNNEQLTLVTLNSQSIIYVTQDGQLCLSVDSTMNVLTESTLKINEYIRLLISVQNKSIKIYVNGLLQLDTSVIDDQLIIRDNRIVLFREQDLTKNTMGEDILRIQCKSITYLNKPTTIIDEKLKSSNYPLEIMVSLPYDIISPNLIRIGYDESQIKSVINENITQNIQLIDTILRENSLLKFESSIDKTKLKNFLQVSTFDTKEKIATLAEVMLIHWDDIQTISSKSIDMTQLSTNKKWFYQAIHHLNIDNTLTEWIRDRSTSMTDTDLIHQLIDMNISISEQTKIITNIENQRKNIQKSIQYSHQQINHQQYINSRISCENGLISMYAHYTMLNILRIWSNNGSNLFPLEKFGNYTFIVTLLRLLDYHYVYTRLYTDENIDRMSSLIISVIHIETNELLKYHMITHDKNISEVLQEKAPLLYQLQKDIIVQLIQFLLNPLLLSYDYNDTSANIDQQTMINQPNFNFIIKLINLFIKLITDRSTAKQHKIDILIPLLFPVPLINLLFDLFLISPLHKLKIIILDLFSTLIQASNNFDLNRHIQHFLFHLFIEVSSNSTSINTQTMKTFQIAIMDVVYLLVKRHKYQRISMNTTNKLVEFDFSQFPQNFHDLLMITDVINALTDKMKHSPFPEAFILQSIILLGDNNQLTADDIEKSNSHFDIAADLQLMNFMNNHPFTSTSFNEFINGLPIESVPNPTYYKTYPFLWDIPAIYIQTRAKVFYLFSMLLETLIPIIDFSELPGKSIITDKIRTSKVYMLYQTKFQLFNTTLEATVMPSDGDMPTVKFDTVKASTSAHHGRHTMFNQAYEQLHDNAHLLFRRTSNHLWRAQYLAMHSTDQGGPFRDSVSWICSDICSNRLPLFILCPNGRTNSGSNRDRWIPNTFPLNSPIPNRMKKQYRFIGQLMGMAIRHKHYLDLKFPILLWKQLVREQITIEDIEAIDVQSFTMINELEKTIKQNNQLINTDSDINDLLSSILDEFRFEVVSSAGQTYELIPDGSKTPITASNFNKYCSSYREYRLNEFSRQIEFICQGLYSVVPGYYLNLFTPNELEEAVCGKGEMDVALLKRNTDYGDNYNQNSQAILRFWTVLNEMFNEEQKKSFLKFVWGRSTLPKCDNDFTSKFKIDPYNVSNGSVDGALPRAHTCSFVLDLPDYSSVDVMYNRLNYAIIYCSSIDGDGNMNDAPLLTDSDSDWIANT